MVQEIELKSIVTYLVHYPGPFVFNLRVVFAVKIRVPKIELETWSRLLYYNHRASIVAKLTFEWFFSFMNWSNMSIQALICRTCIVATLTFEWLLSFMNWSNMCFQGSICGASIVANFTFERLLSFMNWRNVLILVLFARTL